MQVKKVNCKIIGMNFRKIRNDLGLSQRALSIKLGYGKNTNRMVSYESGRTCAPLHIVVTIMEMAELPMEDLYDVLFDAEYILPQIA